MIYFSASNLGFYPPEWKDDGTYDDLTWPDDAILLDDKLAGIYWRSNPPAGKQLGSIGSLPSWVDIPPAPPMTDEEVESFRLRAYSDPLTGSDRMFAESTRMQIMGEDNHEEIRDRAIVRFEEIQAQYPWPTK